MNDSVDETPQDAAIARILDHDLVVRLRTGEWTGLGTAVPAGVDAPAGTRFRISRCGVVEQVTLGDARNAIHRAGEDALHRLTVSVIGPRDGTEHHERPLHEYLTAEIDRDGRHYVLRGGRWFRAPGRRTLPG